MFVYHKDFKFNIIYAIKLLKYDQVFFTYTNISCLECLHDDLFVCDYVKRLH